MDSLLLFLLLLGAAPDRPPVESVSGPVRVQGVASARVLRAAVIDFEAPVDRRDVQSATRGRETYHLSPVRSAGVVEKVDGEKIRLQEFH
ncbi:hypothetical protein [Sphingorhabdus sp. SMR4y]|uniref:hypothetical protein n=1 Tax=Sphingorhabdus sp. SMR4y TaxID=2584094 RepID=UPI000B5CA3C3|nr:hypothetical protein [Sphingorhabdus sp. SMR4y]ASK89128.1 hypothetical protein SPHFLASMR4Y_02386 [Sphingorhabdus sp. SMR4y]